MPRRGGRPSSSSSLHIYSKEMSGINNATDNSSEEPRVVVQTLPAVEPSEERLTPAPHSTTLQHFEADKEKDMPVVEEVRTRLRPHRSSWRDRYSSPEREDPKKTSNSTQHSSNKGNLDSTVQNATSNEIPTKQTAVKSPAGRRLSTENKQNKWSYACEDVATIERNKNRSLKRERTPSTDSAPESSDPKHKHRAKPIENSLPSGKSKASDPAEKKSPRQIKVQKTKTITVRSSQPNGRHVSILVKRSIGKEAKLVAANTIVNTSTLIKEERIEKSDVQITTPSEFPTENSAEIPEEVSKDFPGFCEFCGEEFAYLNVHMQNKHSNTQLTSLPESVSNSQENISCIEENNQCIKESSQQTHETESIDKNMAHEEASLIVDTVVEDELIQKFGIRLLGMSLYPKEKMMTVSQRMIELVRLLRAAQGFEPNIRCLASLLHYDYWPIITRAIMYVAGYQENEGTFRNPFFVFDIGQALKFSAYILKTEAAQSHDFQYEQELKDFMNSIDSKIQEILPSITEFKPLHMLDSHVHFLASNMDLEKAEVSRTEEVSEERQVQALLNDISSSTPQCSTQNLTSDIDMQILSDVLEEAVTSSVELTHNFTSQGSFTETVAPAVQYSEQPGVQQASLLLGLSKAQPSSSSNFSVPQQQGTSQVPSTLTRVSSINAQQARPLTKVRLIKSVTPVPNKTATPNSPPIRFVKIVSAKSSSSIVQPVQRKYCLLIPAQSVQRRELPIKNPLQIIEKPEKVLTPEPTSSSPLTLKIMPDSIKSLTDGDFESSNSNTMTLNVEKTPMDNNLVCGLDLDSINEQS